MNPHRPGGLALPSRQPSGCALRLPKRKRRRPKPVERLWLEPLEDRTLLSVSVSGTIFHDLNPNGVRETNEPALVATTVSGDTNSNGLLDPQVNFTPAAPTTFTPPNPNPGTRAA